MLTNWATGPVITKMPQAHPPDMSPNSRKTPQSLQQAVTVLNNIHTPQGQGIDMMWRLFNRMPKREPRFPHMYAAAMRMAARRASALPPREAFTTTVDYYEAIEPLICARGWFRLYAMANHTRAVRKICDTILPKKLF